MKKSLIALAAFAAGFVFGGMACGRIETVPGRVTVLTRHDTVRIASPPRVAVRYLRPDTVRLAAPATADSVDAIVPVEQAQYAGDGYRAYVSGYRPRLDSLIMLRTVSVAPPARQPRFSVGIQAGYGITPRGMQPYIGVGVAYTIRF